MKCQIGPQSFSFWCHYNYNNLPNLSICILFYYAYYAKRLKLMFVPYIIRLIYYFHLIGYIVPILFN